MKTNNDPMAKIAIKKSLLKEYTSTAGDRTFYLDAGTEFQIYLFNPHTYNIGAEISVNGESMGNKLIIHPGQRVWLDRYLNKQVKLKFDVYEVDSGDAAVEKAIANNGIITVKFYKEKEKSNRDKYDWIYKYPTKFDKVFYDDFSNYKYSNPLATYTTCNSNSSVTYKNLNDNVACSSASLTHNTVDNSMCCFDNIATSLGELSLTSCAFCDSMITGDASFSAPSVSANYYTNKKETGRIAEGSASSQKLHDVDMDFEYLPFETETMKLLPISQKPYTVSDVNKKYCPECGHKIVDKYKFCPYCGEKLQ